jgi:uncharacterized protein DUF1876
MAATKTWRVDIYIGERDEQTHAEARLLPSNEVTLTGRGVARLNPVDRDVPEIGDELAVARALSDLAHQLLSAAVEDIEAVTHAPVDLAT